MTLDELINAMEPQARKDKALLETAPERRSLFDMAMLLIETQNLLDWIEKTDAEKEKLIQNFT